MDELKEKDLNTEMHNKAQLPDEPNSTKDLSPASSKFRSKKTLLILAIVIIVIGLVLSLFLAKSSLKQDAQVPPPDPENVKLASVEGKNIYREDVVKVGLEQYTRDALTSDVLKNSLSIAIERAILDNESLVLGVSIPQENNKVLYYEKLRNEVAARVVGSVTVNTISFWVPAFNDVYPQKPEYQEMRDLQPKVFQEATLGIKNGENVYDIGNSILEKYPVFREQLGINGYILTKTTDIRLMKNPVTYNYLVNDSNKPLMDFIFSLKKGDIKEIVMPEGEGATLVQVIDKNSGNKMTYDKWLEEKKSSVVIDDSALSKL